MTERDRVPEWVIGVGSLTLLYASLWWSFPRWLKEQVREEQDGKCADCGEEAYLEIHHRVPQNALRRQGIKGKDVRENAVGLCFDCHKGKWDELMLDGIIYPGIPLSEAPKEIYSDYHSQRPRKRRR